MIPISQVWRSIDKNGQSLDPNIVQQLRSLGAEVVWAAKQFADDGVSDYYQAGELARQ